MNQHTNIYEAINAIMQDVGYVKKQKSPDLRYTFAGEAALIAAIRPAMVENGVFMYVNRILDVKRENYTTAKGTAMVNTVTTAIVRFAHVSGSFIDVESTGEGSDSGDKSANKAMTGLYKYAMRQTFCIETGDDTDKYATEERAPVESKPAPTEAERKDKALAAYSALNTRAKAVKLELPPMDAGWSIEKMTAHYKEQKAFVVAAEEQAKAGE